MESELSEEAGDPISLHVARLQYHDETENMGSEDKSQNTMELVTQDGITHSTYLVGKESSEVQRVYGVPETAMTKEQNPGGTYIKDDYSIKSNFWRTQGEEEFRTQTDS